MTTRTRYSDKELAMFEELIDQKLAQAERQLTFYENQLTELSESDDAKIKALDDATSTIEAERISELALRTTKYINHLKNAKLRIKNKVYGICRVTGKLISKERLKAVPHATLSIAAKEAR